MKLLYITLLSFFVFMVSCHKEDMMSGYSSADKYAALEDEIEDDYSIENDSMNISNDDEEECYNDDHDDDDHASGQCGNEEDDDDDDDYGDDHCGDKKKYKYKFKKEIVKDLVKSADCDYVVAGTIKYYFKNEWVATVDFGDGTCDEWATKETKDGIKTFKMKK